MAKYLDKLTYRRARCVICAKRAHRRFRLSSIAGTEHPFSATLSYPRNRYHSIDSALKDWS